MKWSMASVGVIVLGIIGVMVIVLFQQLTTSSENDYYLLKEITEASMIESIDLKYYRETGDLKIVKEKFVENFTRRYSESTLFIGTKYTISFFDIIETPPKATIIIDTGMDRYRIYDTVNDYNVLNNLTGILEYVGKDSTKTAIDPFQTNKKTYTQTVYSMLNTSSSSEPLNIPKEINDANMRKQKVTGISTPVAVTDQGEILMAKLRREIDWARASTDGYRTDYFSNNSLSDYSSSSISYYNCSDGSGTGLRVDCTSYKLPWISINRSSSGNVILKYNVTWSYEEYEYK